MLEVFCDFRFEREVQRAACLAGLLTVVSHHAFAGPAPLFLVDANVRGAGKGLLCHALAHVTTGRLMPVSAYSADVEETRKRISLHPFSTQ